MRLPPGLLLQTAYMPELSAHWSYTSTCKWSVWTREGSAHAPDESTVMLPPVLPPMKLHDSRTLPQILLC